MAAGLPGPPLSSSLKSMNSSTCLTHKLLPYRNSNSLLTFYSVKRFPYLIPLNAESSSPQNFSEKPESGGTDPVKLAFAKAKAYKKAIEFNPTPKIVQNNPLPEEDGKTDELTAGAVKGKDAHLKGEDEGVPLSVKLAFLKAKEYTKKNNSVVQGLGDELTDGVIKGKDAQLKGKEEGIPLSAKLAFQKVEEYTKNNNSDNDGFVNSNEQSLGLMNGNKKNAENSTFTNDSSKNDLKVSSIDFVGLEFSEKKSKKLPAGLIPQVDYLPEGDLPEVEILVGDTSMFGDGSDRSNEVAEDDSSDIYKPKVSTWGVFPRPNNISKTFGGGRTIQPGEVLETAQDKASKQARTRKLLAAYQSKFGMNIDPKLKSECEQELKDGDSLMDVGKLKEALPFYEKVMDKLPFQNELYGLAALQWSICQDSLTRPNEARIMYEKLQSHSDVNVRKKARELLFSFQAMEMMKVTSSKLSTSSVDYKSYFEAFVREEAAAKFPVEEAEVDEGGALRHSIPYMIFLVSPVLIVLLIAFYKGP